MFAIRAPVISKSVHLCACKLQEKDVIYYVLEILLLINTT